MTIGRRIGRGTRTIPPTVWNPLSLPILLLGIAAELPRAMANLARAGDLLEEAMERVDRLGVKGDAMLEEMTRARELIERLATGGDDLVAAADRTHAEAERAREAIERAQPAADAIARNAGPMLEAAVAAQEQLAATNAELVRANEQLARAIEMAGPLETVSARVERLAGSFRRDSAS